MIGLIVKYNDKLDRAEGCWFKGDCRILFWGFHRFGAQF